MGIFNEEVGEEQNKNKKELLGVFLFYLCATFGKQRVCFSRSQDMLVWLIKRGLIKRG